MKLAIVGTRGVPAAYGGFETFAEELGARLVERGHQMTVYGRSHVVPAGLREHRGMRLRVLPTIRHKYLDTVVHTALSVVDALPRRFEVVLICNVANAPFAIVPRLGGARVALNVDGLEWQRAKWGRLGRSYYRFCSWLAVRLPLVLVSDADVIADYYREHHGRATTIIPYGTEAQVAAPGPTLAEHGLAPRGYILYVSRLEPENHPEVVIEAYGRAQLDLPLVVVGDAPYGSAFKARLTAMAPPKVIFTGFVFGEGYAELQSNALVYVQATEVGGTHPALVEAMGRGVAIIANDVPEHHEVLGDAGLYYDRNDAGDLARQLRALVADAAQREALGASAQERARARYSWARVTDQYEALFRGMLAKGGRAART
jgi:glycosyltransferase involved in cell wall biosynthesis